MEHRPRSAVSGASADPPFAHYFMRSQSSFSLPRAEAWRQVNRAGIRSSGNGAYPFYGLGESGVRLDTILASDMMQGPEKDSQVRAFRAGRMPGQAKGLRDRKPWDGPIASGPSSNRRSTSPRQFADQTS